MRDFLLIYLNGRPIEVRGDDAFLTLSDYLRQRQRLIGTKVVCAEGDCGSCTVLLGRLVDGSIRYSAVTSCIQLVAQLDGMHVVTIEGLKDGDALNPIQEAMVACHGTQCGFCTPGFVVTLAQLLDDPQPCTAERVRRGLVGNLCRCTGYDAITRAALATDRTRLRTIDQRYPQPPILAALERAAADEVLIETDAGTLYKPVTLEQAIGFRAANPTCSIVSGATDVGVLVNKRVRQVRTGLILGGVRSLRSIKVTEDAVVAGAAATLSELETATLTAIPELGRYLAWFGSPQIKNAGTLAGNVATGSPIGDSLPPLHVLDADVELTGPRGTRRVNINDFYTGYRQSVLAADELITAVHIPIPKPGEIVRLYKVSKRQDLDISTFSAAFRLCTDGESITAARVAFGGVGPTVLRMRRVESQLVGQPIAQATFERAAHLARAEVTPISDVRGSDEYRRTLAGNALRKLWHDLAGASTASVGGT